MEFGNVSRDCRSPESGVAHARGSDPRIEAPEAPQAPQPPETGDPGRDRGDAGAGRPPWIAAAATAAWDAVVRIWLVTRAWLGRAAPPSRLAQITGPRRFVRAAVVAVGRPVALAIAFLPRTCRDEAAIAVLACRALCALDRRSADPAVARDRIARAIGYLAGESEHPPDAGALRAMRTGIWPADPTVDLIDALLADRLAMLRAALELLPGAARRRCRDLIERVGDGLMRVRRDRRGHADHVLGEAVVYAARLAAPGQRPPVAACRAAGRALQFGRDRDLAVTAHERDLLLDRALPALAFVPRLLRWVPAAAGAGTRAAAALAILTAFPLSPDALTVAMPRRLRHPLRAALAAAGSPRAMLGVADAIDAALHEARRALFERLDGPVVAPVPPAVPPDAVVSDAALISLAMELARVRADLAG